MTRMGPLLRENMNDRQKAVFDKITADGGRIGGPYTAYIRTPEFMQVNQEMGNVLRSNTLPSKLRLLAAITVIRYWGAEFPWAMNARDAASEGISQDIIDAINQGERPIFPETAEQLIFDFSSELLNTKNVSDETYNKAKKLLDEECLASLIETIGFYSMVSMTTLSIRVEAPATEMQVLIK